MSGIYWISSYPKSGNTWFRIFLHNLRSDASRPVDINDLTTGSIASSRGWFDSVMGFESSDLTHEEIDRLRASVYRWSLFSAEAEYHKIHDAYQLGSDGTPMVTADATLSAVYIIRNPLDVASSLANHLSTSVDAAIAMMANPEATMSDSNSRAHRQLRQFLGTWSGHVRSWTEAPKLHCHVLRYEDMLATPLESFRAAASFLGLPHEPASISNAIASSSFEVLSRQEEENGFRERPARVKRFFLSGRAGIWRERLSSDQVDRILQDHELVMRRFGYCDAEGHPV